MFVQLYGGAPSWRVKARGESGKCTTREANKGSRTVGQRRGFSSAVCIFPFFSFCMTENVVYHVIFHCGKNIKANAAPSAGCVAAAAMTQCICAPVRNCAMPIVSIQYIYFDLCAVDELKKSSCLNLSV